MKQYLMIEGDQNTYIISIFLLHLPAYTLYYKFYSCVIADYTKEKLQLLSPPLVTSVTESEQKVIV